MVLYAPESEARGRCEIAPDTWFPSLEQVGDFLDESARADVKAPQQTLNLNSQNRADIRDAQLFVVYIELMQRLNARQRAELFKEQKRWLGKRNEYAEITVVSRGGSLAPMEYNAAFRAFTEDRILQLQIFNSR